MKFEKPKKTLEPKVGEIWYLKDDKDVESSGSHPYFVLNTSAGNDEADRIYFLPISHGFYKELPFYTLDKRGEYNLCYINYRAIVSVNKESLTGASYAGYKYDQEMIEFLQNLVMNYIIGDLDLNKKAIELYTKEYNLKFAGLIERRSQMTQIQPEQPKVAISIPVQPQPTQATATVPMDSAKEKIDEIKASTGIVPEDLLIKIANKEIKMAKVARDMGLTYNQVTYQYYHWKKKETDSEHHTMQEIKELFNHVVKRSQKYACARGINEKKNILLKEMGKLKYPEEHLVDESIDNLYQFVKACRGYDKNIVAACYGKGIAEIESKLLDVKEYADKVVSAFKK